MKLSDAYPSRYLKADVDVPEDGQLVLTIDGVEMRTFGQGKDAQDKPVISFVETDKELVLNKTNWRSIAAALGSDDTDHWSGRAITLYSSDVQFGTDITRGIRVRNRAPKAPKPASKTATIEATSGDEGEDIPF